MKKDTISNMSGNTVKREIVRLPRPNGSTALAIEAYKTNNESILKSYQEFIINHWLLSNGFVSGVVYDINSLSKSLGINPEDIRLIMRDKLISSRIFDKDKQDDMLKGLIGELVSWSLEDRMKINSQISILINSQNGKYTPFVTSELNKALKLGLDSNTTLQGVLSKLLGGGTTNVFNLFQQNNNDNSVNNNYVTSTEVLEILSHNELDKSDQVKYLDNKYDFKSLPEVVATKQDGVDSSKEGLESLDINKLTQVTDNLKLALEASKNDHHEMRREIDMRIDPDSEDPELDIYEEIPDDDSNNFSAMDYLNND